MSDLLRLGLCQMELSWEDPAENFKRIERLVGQSETEFDLLVLPEMFSTGYTMKPEGLPRDIGERTLEWMKSFSRRAGVSVTGSSVCKEGVAYFNRLWFVSPEEDRVHTYDKRHLFTLAGEHHHYQAGKALTLIEFRGFRILPLICYDLRFPVWSRNTMDYDLLLYVANWPQPRIQAWDMLLRARAIENMAYCAGVNRIGDDDGGYQYPGHSALIDPLGGLQVRVEGETIAVAEIRRSMIQDSREKLRFLEDRDRFEFQL